MRLLSIEYISKAILYDFTTLMKSLFLPKSRKLELPKLELELPTCGLSALIECLSRVLLIKSDVLLHQTLLAVASDAYLYC